jgi:dihydropteroate synthase
MINIPLRSIAPRTANPPSSLPFLVPLVMGIVNVTPDSFSDGGLYLDAERAARHAIALVDEGADIIDIGGESTRPPGKDYGAGSMTVSEDEEIRRVVPVIERLRDARPEVTISIDTMKRGVAHRAVEAGASIINDVSAGRYDSSIIALASELGLPYVLMHGHNPGSRVDTGSAAYADVVGEVHDFLRERIAVARRAGIRTVIADVGLGFAKGAADNERLLREHARFLDLGVPMLVGASRKAFIGRALGGLPPEERVFGTLAAHAVAAINGASIVRVHDVRAAREFFTVMARLMGERDASPEV